VCAKNHPDRLSRLATIHQRYRRTDGRTDFLWHRPRPNGRPKNCAVSMLKLTTGKHEASRGLSATAELLVIILSLLDPGIEKRDAGIGIVEFNVPLDTL